MSNFTNDFLKHFKICSLTSVLFSWGLHARTHTHARTFIHVHFLSIVNVFAQVNVGDVGKFMFIFYCVFG